MTQHKAFRFKRQWIISNPIKAKLILLFTTVWYCGKWYPRDVPLFFFLETCTLFHIHPDPTLPPPSSLHWSRRVIIPRADAVLSVAIQGRVWKNHTWLHFAPLSRTYKYGGFPLGLLVGRNHHVTQHGTHFYCQGSHKSSGP